MSFCLFSITGEVSKFNCLGEYCLVNQKNGQQITNDRGYRYFGRSLKHLWNELSGNNIFTRIVYAHLRSAYRNGDELHSLQYYHLLFFPHLSPQWQ